ncbi:MAG: hypothetical protein PHI59_05155 [Candidatus Omnitrophica bacterium]|nr:hypothetical protein [Candidatus Omnitrophota bacterium]
MSELRISEVKSISVISVFKYFGGISLIAGLVIGLFGSFLRMDVVIPESIKTLPLMSKIGPGIPTGIVLGVICGISAGLGFSILALLYNFSAGILGGIKLFMKDE